MAKKRPAKEESVAKVVELLKSARGLVFADYTGLTVKDLQDLRRQLRAQGVSYEVTKKTLLGRSLKAAGLNEITTEALKGSVSVAVSQTDEVEPARILVGFAKTHEKLQLLGGILEAKFIDGAKVRSLAKLPSKQELLGQLVGTIAAPLSGFVNVLQGNLRGLVQVLKVLSNKNAN